MPACGARPARKEPSRPTLGVLLEHRPDERSHHVPEERVRGDREVELVVPALPGRRADVPREDVVCVSERVKAVKSCVPTRIAADACRGSRSSGRGHQSARASPESGSSGPRQDDVAIRASPSRRSRAWKPSGSGLARYDGDVVGQHACSERPPVARRAGRPRRAGSRPVPSRARRRPSDPPRRGRSSAAARRRARPAGRLRSSGAPAAAPNPGTRCRRTRASGEASSRRSRQSVTERWARRRARGRRPR